MATLLAACGGGSSNGYSTRSSSATTANCPGNAFNGSLGCLQDLIFTPKCASCHSGAAAQQGLQLDSPANTYAQTVNVASVEQPSFSRVRAGDAANSYLVQKVLGTAATCCQMPNGGPYLSSTEISAVAAWINSGAAASP
jgi:hypothetical protein